MNKREMKTVLQEAIRSMPESTVHEVEGVSNSVRVKTPFVSSDDEFLYFYITRRNKDRRFSLILPAESLGILPVNTTLVMLQSVLKTYGLLLSQEGTIMEENTAIPLHKRMRRMAQAIVAIDGIRRIWKVEFNRRQNATESEDTRPASNATNDRSSR